MIPVLRHCVLPGAGQLEPLKEANAAVILTEHGFKTHEQVALEMGGDWESNINQMVIKNQRLAEAGGGRIIVPIDPEAGEGEGGKE